jgi:hypothetical protein
MRRRDFGQIDYKLHSMTKVMMGSLHAIIVTLKRAWTAMRPQIDEEQSESKNGRGENMSVGGDALDPG